jgi:hypothetical protein
VSYTLLAMADRKGKRPQSKKKRRGRAGAARKRSGVMLGMRRGFKTVASSVTGVEPKKKSGTLGTVIMVALVLAAAALLFYRS